MVCGASRSAGSRVLPHRTVPFSPAVAHLLIGTARRWPGGRFVVAGPKFPDGIGWPRNVDLLAYLAPPRHRDFYCAQRFTLNVTRAAMAAVGWSPSVRLFEAAACGTPIISDGWEGIETLFTPDREILIARSARDILPMLIDIPDVERRAIGERARRRVMRQHTAARRAHELEAHVRHALGAVIPT